MLYRIIILTVIIIPSFAAIPDGYVSYWKFDGDLTDEMGTNNGVMTEGTADFQEGISGQGIRFSGNSVNVGKDVSLDFSGSFTIGGWVYLTYRSGTLFGKSTWNSGFYMKVAGSWPPEWQFTFQGREHTEDTEKAEDQVGRWVHVVGVYDGTNMYQYRDGVPVDTTASAGMAPTTASLLFGPVSGTIDEMIYYDRVLTGPELTALMNATKDTTPPAFSGISAVVQPAFAAEVTCTTSQESYCDIEFYADGVGPFTYSNYDAKTVHSLMINGLQAATEWYYRVHAVNRRGYESTSPWCTLAVATEEPDQKFSLAYADPPRKTVSTSLVWPADVGDADVCLYPDDKLAAISITIDDNQANNWDWWKNWASVYDQRYTWFINCNNIGVTTQANAGTWDGWRELYAAGHAVQSHGYTHSNSMRTYGMCRVAVEENIPGNRCITHAYASGGATEDRDTAALVFQASRGVNLGINTAGRINYRDVRWTDPRDAMTAIDQILTPGSSKRRGWIGGLKHHYLNAADTAYTASVLAYMYEHRDSLLTATYPEIIRYSQSFDTHILTVNSVTASAISFTLTDSMLDTIFNTPLTVKVRIDNGWSTCTAVQNGHSVEATVVEHDGNKYALVKAVPDRGEVIVSNSGVSMVAMPVISPDGGSGVCSVLVSISCTDSTADIYYTTDGSTPDSTASLYNGPFSVRDDATVKAKAYNGTDLPSGVASAAFSVVTQAGDVIANPAGGTYDDTVTVTLSCATAGATIRYTLDGSEPDETDDAYTDGIILTDDATLKAKAFHPCLAAGGTLAEAYVVDIPASGMYRRALPALPGFTGTPMYLDCNGRVLRGVPQVPGVYFFYDGELFRKTVVVE